MLQKSKSASPDAQQSRGYLLTQVVNILDEVTHSLPRVVSPEWFTLDLSMPQVRVVFLLLQETSLRMSDVASNLDISMSRATGLVDRLVEKELVNRWTDPDDRRSVLCSLTNHGNVLGNGLIAARRSRWEDRLAALSQLELGKVSEAMQLVLSATHKAEHGIKSMK